MGLLSFFKALFARFGLPLGLVVFWGIGYVVYEHNARFTQLSKSVQVTTDVLSNLEKNQTFVERAETHQRGFLYSGHNEDLVRYNEAVRGLTENLPRLTPLVKENPAQLKRLNHLRELVHARIEAANAGILNKQSSLSGNHLLPLRLHDNGTRMTQQIRDAIEEMSQEEHRLLVQRANQTQEVGSQIVFLLILGFSLPCLLILISTLARRADLKILQKKDFELKARSNLMDSILNSMSEALIVVDEDGFFTHYNAAAQKIIGTKIKTISNEEDAQRLGFHEAETGYLFTKNELPFHQALRARCVDDQEILVQNETHPEGLYIDLSSRSLSDIDGRISGAMVVFKDVSRRKAVEQEWAKARESALEASKMKSDFLAAMSHEIRTPMNGVIGMATLLGETPLSPEQGDYVGTIKRSAQSLLMLINDILDHSKIEAGKVTLDPQPFDLQVLAKDVIDMFRPLTAEKNIGLQLEIPEGFSWLFHGDQGRLRQVLVNLMGNAVKFTEKGFVSLVFEQTVTVQRKSRIRVQVKDTGPGLAENDRQSLFQQYFQTRNGKKMGGTGLGLSISKQLIDLMKGSIGLDSVPGVGSNFWFELELSPCLPEELPQFSDAKFSAIFQGHVLVAEDQVVNQKVAMNYLKNMGLQVDIANNGQQAVEMAQRKNYDLIFMDCQMPLMTGYEATRALRDLEYKIGHVKIIALTAEGASGEKGACFEAGMDDFLTKPLELARLIETLQRWLKPLEAAIDLDSLEKLKKYIVKDQNLALVLIQDYEDSSPSLIEGMKKSVAAKDLSSLAEFAHALKSSSATLGAHGIAKICQELEDLKEVSETAELRVFELEKEYKRSLVELKNYSANKAKAA